MKNTVYGALYLRSATIEPDSVQRLAENRQQLEKRAAQEGVTIFKVYEDQGISGLSKPHSRPGISALLDDISQGHIQVLYIAGIDRLSRDADDSTILLRQLQDAGIKIRIGDQEGDLMRWPELGALYDQLTAVS